MKACSHRSASSCVVHKLRCACVARSVISVTGMCMLATLNTTCGVRRSEEPEVQALPETFVLRIDEVVVRPFRPGTEESWDGPAVEEDPATGCKLLAAG